LVQVQSQVLKEYVLVLLVPVELVKLVIMFESVDTIEEEDTVEFCKLIKEKVGGIAIEVEGTAQGFSNSSRKRSRNKLWR
jgi:hypothetical protein